MKRPYRRLISQRSRAAALRLACVVFGAMLLASACSADRTSSNSVAAVLDAVEPGLRVGRIGLPTTVGAVLLEHPSARITAQGVLADSAEKEWYFSIGRAESQIEASRADTVRGVSVVTRLSGFEMSETEWQRVLARFHSATESTPKCTQTMGPVARSRVARWRLVDGVVFAQVFLPNPQLLEGAPAPEPKLVIGGSLDESLVRSLWERAQAVDCSSMLP